MNYSLNDLRALDTLLQYRHVSQAANRMGMSQSAMSMTLKRLREVFGDRLLVRQGNRLVLTDVAARLHPKIQFMIKDMEELATDTSGFDPAGTRRGFTLILTDYIDAILVPPLHRKLRELAPLMELHIVGPDPFRISTAIGEGRVDLTVSYFPNAPDDLIARRLFSDRLVCITRRDHPARWLSLTPEVFCQFDHVAVEPAGAMMYRAALDRALKSQGLSRRIAISKPDFVSIPFLLEQSDLIATVPERLAQLFSRHFALHTFPPPIDLPRLDIQMMWHRSMQHLPAHIWLRDLITGMCLDLR